MIKARALKFGDTIGVVSPASPTSEENVGKVYDRLTKMGFKVEMGRSNYKRHGYLAGKDDLRAEDINQMFANQEIDGIICMRGGYGSPRILDLIDYDLVRANPKVFVGYSDISGLHLAFNQICNLISFHGPMLASDMLDGLSDFSRQSLYRSIMGQEDGRPLDNPAGQKIVTINGGLAEGQIIGGNLSLIVDTLGTAYEIDTRGKILFLEEVGEETYNIDRMFNQLRLAGKLDQAAAIVLGDFKDCVSEKHEENLSLDQLIDDYIKATGRPAIYNLQAGHCEPMLTLPLGARARLDGTRGQLSILENPVV